MRVLENVFPLLGYVKKTLTYITQGRSLHSRVTRNKYGNHMVTPDSKPLYDEFNL